HDVRRVDVTSDDRLVRDLGRVVGRDDPVPLVGLVVNGDVLGFGHGSPLRLGISAAPNVRVSAGSESGRTGRGRLPGEQRVPLGRLHAYRPIDGSTPACWKSVSMSVAVQRSTTLPPAIRTKSVCVQTSSLPEGSAPYSGSPVCVPRTTEWAATWLPSHTMFGSSTSKSRSGIARQSVE